MMNNLRMVCLSLLLLSGITSMAQEYETDWAALGKHNESPEWFKDAKFGIYFHWGPYSVPAYGNEHYPRTMYGHVSGRKPKPKGVSDEGVGVGFQTYREHDFHKKKYGEPKDFEYHDLIPMFSASAFNAEKWADLFLLSGAKFAGPVTMHHDGYAMWDSKITPWNTVKTGPRMDVLGELALAIRKRDMKLVTTFHHAKVGRYPEGADLNTARRWHYYGREKYLEREMPERVNKDSKELQKLYGTMPWQDFCGMWNDLLEEVIDNYKPDIIWFDSWLDRLPQKNRKEFAAYYLNAAQSWGKEVVITYKQKDLPQNVGVIDFEKGRMDELTDYTWLTDGTISDGTWTTTGSWSYTEELDIKSSKTLLHILIDIVSKNGNFLLNISPTAEGLIPEAQQKSLLEMGEWLRANGEAIYGTRPFVTYGEGPKRLKGNGHFVAMTQPYNEENIRFTTKGNAVYAIQMGWAGSEKEVLIKTFAEGKLNKTKITNVSVLDSPEKIEWSVTKEGLLVKTPFRASNKTAICFKIETQGWDSMTSELPLLKMEPIDVDGE
ncbi:alpha-L-fucosidase [Labilibacter sediminis]|nr:alpha-L-fucosidase [Labilibacter sediminis]